MGLLDWEPEELPELVSFLSSLRGLSTLLSIEGYQDGITYANQMEAKGYLADLARRDTIQLLLSEQRLSLEQAMLQDGG